jgi:hypothetical protein
VGKIKPKSDLNDNSLPVELAIVQYPPLEIETVEVSVATIYDWAPPPPPPFPLP